MFLGMVEEMGCVITQPIFFLRGYYVAVAPRLYRTHTHTTCIFLTGDNPW